MNSVELSELRVLRGVQHHHASLHELISLHSHMLIAQIEKLRSDVATLETELTESRLQQQKQLSVLREQQQLLESQNAEIEGVRASKSSHAIEIESVRNALQREIQALTEKLAVAEVAFEAEAASKRTAEAALITARNDAEKKLSDVRAQMSEHHNALLAQQRSLLSETFAKEAEFKQTAAIALEREKFSEKMAETKSLLRSVVETLKKENEELTVQLEDAEKENDDLLSRLGKAETVVRSVQQASLAVSMAAEAKTLAERDARDKLDREIKERENRERAIREKELREAREQQQQIQQMQREKEEHEMREREAKEKALQEELEIERARREVQEEEAIEAAASAKAEAEAKKLIDEAVRRRKAEEEESLAAAAAAAAAKEAADVVVSTSSTLPSSSSLSNLHPTVVEPPAAVISSPQRSFGVKVGGINSASATANATASSSSSFNAAAVAGAPKRTVPSFLSSVAATKLHEQALKAATPADSSLTSSIASTEVPSLSSSSTTSSTTAAAVAEVIPIEERARREAERLRNRSVFGGLKKEAANEPPAAAPPSVPKWKASLLSSTSLTAPAVAPAPANTLAPVPAPIISAPPPPPSASSSSSSSSSSSRALDMLSGVNVSASSEASPPLSSSSLSKTTAEGLVPESEEVLTDVYSSMSKEELKTLLEDRGLSTDGKKVELQGRLREDDAAKKAKEKEERKAKKKLEKAAAAAVAALTATTSPAVAEGVTTAPMVAAAAAPIIATVLPQRKPPPAPPQ